ncbi:hypothetical protein CPC16_000715 [Podila verticillata]|nr:hypothetical protein CPC16_000715 [Podila verticillata]
MDSGNNHSGFNWTQQQSAIPQNQVHDPLSVLLSALAHVDPNYQQPQQPQPMQAAHNDPILAEEQSTFDPGQLSHFDSTMSTPYNDDHLDEDQGLSETPGHPRPLATKPLYKKRVIVPLAKPDGIIRRTGAAAMEKQWTGSRPGANFYDQSMAFASTVELPEQGSTPARKQSKVAKAAASISASKSHRKGGRPKKTPKEPKPPKEPRLPRQLKEPRPPKPKPPKAPTPPPVQYAPPALLAPPNRKISIEALGKKQELYRDKIMKMANRPMPPRELRVLVEAELEEEKKTLREISSSLHKELLKLQLEEGVFLNMLRMAAAGGMELEISDFKKVKRRRRSDASRAVMVGEHGESSSHPITIPSDSITQGQGNHEIAQVQTQEEGARGLEQERQIPTLVRDEDEDEDDQEAYEDEDDAFSEDWISKPTVHLPAQTYSMPGLPDMVSNVGRPSSSAIPSITNLRETDLEPGVENPLDALKRMIVARGKQKTLQESGSKENNMELDEDDLYTMDNDEDDDEEMLIELDDGGDEEEEEELLRSLHRGGGSKANEKPQPGPDQRNNNDSSGTESDDYGDEDDGEGEDDDEDDDEDEDRAREALQRMMSQYGVPGV